MVAKVAEECCVLRIVLRASCMESANMDSTFEFCGNVELEFEFLKGIG